MIICIKLQRKYIFKSDGAFLSRNFNEEEILEENNLMTQIKGVETLKFNTKTVVKYLCKVLICLAIALLSYLLFDLKEIHVILLRYHILLEYQLIEFYFLFVAHFDL